MSNVQIPNLPVATSLNGQEEIEIVQAGVSRRTTTKAIADLNPPQGTVTEIDTAGGLSGGPITTTGTIQIAAAGVDNTKLADMPAYTVKGRNAGTTGVSGDITMPDLSTMLNLAPSATIDTTNADNITSGQLSDQRYYQTLSSAINRMVSPVTPDTGTLLYYGGSSWTALTNGSAGQVLRSRGGGLGPEWFTTTGTGTVVQVDTGTGLTGGPITISGTIAIANTGVTAASYGNASQTLTMSVNAQGQLTTAAAVSIAIDTSQITTGTLAVARGGTGRSTYLVGDILYASAPTTLTSLQAGTADYVITSNGIGLPPSYKQVNLATAVTGTLPVGNGGTGATTLTGYVKGNGTSAFTASATIPNTDITGLGTMSVQNANTVAITGGAIDGTTVGASTPSTGAFTTLTATTLTGYVKANGSSVMTASATIPNTDITGLGTMSVQNASAVAITGGTATLTSVALTSGTVVNAPVAGIDIANKDYVDSVAQGLDIKASAEYATTGNITLSGLGTQAGGDWPTALTAGMRILVKNQTNAANNGIYAASSSGWTRTPDADTWNELVSAFIFVRQGTTQSDTGWVCTVDPGGTLGVTPITWTQFSGAGTYTAGTGLTLTGTVFSITNTGVTATSYGTASAVPTIAVNAQGQITSAINTPIAIDASAITSGTLPVARGGSGASSLTGYLVGNGTSPFSATATIPNTDITGLGTMSTQNAGAVAITGGTIDGTTIGGTTASTGKFTSATITGLTGYVYANGSSALTASATIPGSAISGNISGNAANVTGVVAISNGGTGNSSASAAFDALSPTTTRGDIIYRNATTNTRLAVGAANYALLSNGTDPVWGQVSLTAGVTGTLPATNGGTGINTYTVGDILYANSTTTLAKLAASVSGSVLISNGAGTAPSWSSTIPTTAGVSSLSFGTTGLTPATASTGALTVAGTLVVANGGTGATTLTGYVKGNGTSAMTASATIPNTDITGLGTMSTQNASSVAITGGSINGTTIGGTTRAAGSFTSVNANSTSTFSADILMTGTGGIEIPAGTTGQRPSPATAGYIRYNTTTAKFEGYGSTWGNLGGGAAISDTPPSNPGAGDLWWSSADGNLYVYYTDANSSQWVSTTSGGQGAYLPLTGGTISGNLTITGTLTGSTGIMDIGSGQFYKDASGNVGIGTSSPAARLDVRTPAGTAAQQNLYSGSSAAAATLQFGQVGSIAWDTGITATNGHFQIGVNGGGLGYNINRSGAAIDYHSWFTAGSERMRIDSSGNVGIGPSATNRLSLTYNSVSGEATFGPNSTSGSTFLTFGTSNSGTYAERARITSGGSFLVGTSSDLARFTVVGGISGSSIYATVTRSGTSDSGTFPFIAQSASGSNVSLMRGDGAVSFPFVYSTFTSAAAANVVIDTLGYLYRSTSSIKYKREVVDATHGLTELLSLRPVTYKGNAETDGETVFGGLIAEEVHDAGLTEFVQYADDGTPDALAYGNMVSLCIKAIQELKAELDTAKAEIAALKGAK